MTTEDTMTASDFLKTFPDHDDVRLWEVPSFADYTILHIPVNFESLRTRIAKMLEAAYAYWDPLLDMAQQNFIDKSIIDLSCAFIYILYIHLRRCTGMMDSLNFDIYSEWCPFSKNIELPTGLISLVKQFGDRTTQDTWKNLRILHQWDKKNEQNFGISDTVTLNHCRLTGFLDLLKTCKVPFCTLDDYKASPTLWDSLLVKKDNGYSCDTTFPRMNYQLPRDVFLAIALCGPTRITDDIDIPIRFYSPHIQGVHVDVYNSLIGLGAENSMNQQPSKKRCTEEKEKMETTDATRNPVDIIEPTVDDSDAQYIDETRLNVLNKTEEKGNSENIYPCSPLQQMTSRGIQPQNVSEREGKFWIYGRGTIDDVIDIHPVACGINDYEVYEFYRCLFRHGP